MVCNFHLTTDHDGASCPKMIRALQMLVTNKREEYQVEEPITLTDVNVNFFEYEYNNTEGENLFIEIDKPNCTVLTRSQYAQKKDSEYKSNNDKSTSHPKYIMTRGSSSNFRETKMGQAQKPVEVPFVTISETFPGSFDIIESYKNRKI